MSSIGFFVILAAAQASSSLSAPPEMRERPSLCTCADDAGDVALTFDGIVVDAEMRLAANGRDPDPRQATVFRVSKSSAPLETETVKVWHVTDRDDCGVVFDYGRQYTIAARKVEGELETNYCIDPRYERTRSGGAESDTANSDIN